MPPSLTTASRLSELDRSGNPLELSPEGEATLLSLPALQDLCLTPLDDAALAALQQRAPRLRIRTAHPRDSAATEQEGERLLAPWHLHPGRCVVSVLASMHAILGSLVANVLHCTPSQTNTEHPCLCVCSGIPFACSDLPVCVSLVL